MRLSDTEDLLQAMRRKPGRTLAVVCVSLVLLALVTGVSATVTTLVGQAFSPRAELIPPDDPDPPPPAITVVAREPVAPDGDPAPQAEAVPAEIAPRRPPSDRRLLIDKQTATACAPPVTFTVRLRQNSQSVLLKVPGGSDIPVFQNTPVELSATCQVSLKALLDEPHKVPQADLVFEDVTQ